MGEPKTCIDCRYFRQHYVRRGNHQYMPLDEGHCVYPRLKNRHSATPVCQCYREKKSAQLKTSASSEE